MTKKQIEQLANDYHFPNEYVEILLKKYNYDIEKVKEILSKPFDYVYKEIRNPNGVTVSGLMSIMEARYKKRNGLT